MAFQSNIQPGRHRTGSLSFPGQILVQNLMKYSMLYILRCILIRNVLYLYHSFYTGIIKFDAMTSVSKDCIVYNCITGVLLFGVGV